MEGGAVGGREKAAAGGQGEGRRKAVATRKIVTQYSVDPNQTPAASCEFGPHSPPRKGYARYVASVYTAWHTKILEIQNSPKHPALRLRTSPASLTYTTATLTHWSVDSLHFAHHGERARRSRRSVRPHSQNYHSSTLHIGPSLPRPPAPSPRAQHSPLTSRINQLRAAQVQRHEPHNQGQGPRQRAAIHRQGRRERPLHWREPDVRAVRVRAVDGGGRRQLQPAGAEGRVPERGVEREQVREVGVCRGRSGDGSRKWKNAIV